MPHLSIRSHLTVQCLAAFAALVWSSDLVGQCTNPWPTVPGSAGVEGEVHETLVYDPDGAGPIGERVLVSGRFTVAGTTMAANLAIYDPGARTWSAFGSGPYPGNLELAGDPTSDLYVGGFFTDIAGVAAANVAHFDGTNWSPVGGGVDNWVSDVQVLASGDLVVAGAFTNAGATPVNSIAKWDGASWSALGANAIGLASFASVVELPNGDLCASAAVSGGSVFRGVMCFDGTSWVALGPSYFWVPRALVVSPTGELFAGSQAVFGGAPVGRWNGSSWSPLPNPPFQFVTDLLTLPNGILVAAGRSGSSAPSKVATWDGFVWTSLGEASGAIENLAVLANGDLIAGGDFYFMDDVAAANIARWSGSSWSAASNGFSYPLSWLASRPDGSLFAGLAFGWRDAGMVYQWNGSSWMSIGGGYQISIYNNPSLNGLYAMADGELISCGSSDASALPSPVMQSWDGSSWTTIATAISGSVGVVTKLANGDLIAAGSFNALDGVPLPGIGRFDGVTWSPLGNGLPQQAKVIRELPNGDLLVLALSSVLRWNGTNWIQLGLSPGGTARALVIGTDGQPILAGTLPGADVLRWNGSVWAPLGNGPSGPVQSLAVHANGDLIAGPLIDANNPARPVERWDGVSWTPLGSDVNGTVLATEVSVTGEVLLGGSFTIANGNVRSRFARIATSCPATSQLLSSGCNNTFSTPVLAPDVLPWLGSTSRNTLSNLSNASLAVVVTGLSQVSLPLSSVTPTASFGCNLLVSSDVLQLAVPDAGVVVIEFVIPNVPSLLAANYLQQVVTVHLDAAGTITDSKSSNALLLQVGAF